MKKFYDIHYHAFDLSHANLLAFITREDLVTKATVNDVLKQIPWYLKLLPIGILNFFEKIISQKIGDFIKYDTTEFRNLLSVIENSIDYHFLYVEYFLKNRNPNIFELPQFKENFQNKIILTPLLVDFGYKNLRNENYFYNMPPSKPIVNQVLDVLNAIYYYYHYDILPHSSKDMRLDIVVKKDIDLEQQKSEKLFEIYPFLGINPVNYDLDEINMMFEKYFYGYTQDTPEERKTKLYNKLGTVETTMEELISEAFHRENPGYFSYIFSGIKLYPPLGFNPWPIGNPEAFEKVNLLYRKCLEHRLPITVHCSDGGFKASKLSKVYTNPANEWQSVLNHPEYSKLKINFAHLGNQSNGSSAWQHSIIQSIHKNRNVFTDCSCVAIDDDDFKKIGRMMCDEKISQNMLFGTDFLINLIWSNSYNDYLYNFLKTEILPINQKIQMCSDNPENFLFG